MSFEEDSVMENFFSEFKHRKLTRITEINRTVTDGCGRLHEANKTLDEIIAIAEGAGLLAIAIDRDGFALQGLHNKIRDDTTILRVHARTIGVENTSDFNFEVDVG